MRHGPTPQEDKLWRRLRGRRFAAHKFRRQVPIGAYIVDFVCFEARVIVEVDGAQHAESPHDRQRDAWLSAEGFRVLRFWNNQIDQQMDAAADAIWHALEELKR